MVWLAVSASVLTAAPGLSVSFPLWKEGMSWVVEHEPTSLPNRPVLPTRGDYPTKRFKSETQLWKFSVDKVLVVGDLKLYSLSVHPRDEGLDTTAELVFAGHVDASGNQDSLFLLKGIYRYPSKGSVNEIRRDYNKMSSGPFPVLNDANTIPCDFPYFYPAAPVDPKDADGLWKEFAYTRKLQKESYGYKVRQTILFNTQKVRRPEKYKVVLERKENMDVYIRQKPDDHVARLVFNPKFPWPVFGESPKGKFWLLPENPKK